MLIRRLEPLLAERVEQLDFDLATLFGSTNGFGSRAHWRVLSPLHDAPFELADSDFDAFMSISGRLWTEQAELVDRMGTARLERWLQQGLLVSWQPGTTDSLDRWHGPSAVIHRHARWRDVDASAPESADAPRTLAEMVARHGPPPDEYLRRSDARAQTPLPAPQFGALEALCARRVTCRNFDAERPIAVETAASLLHAVFGEQARAEVTPGAFALKKNSPSGGGLHPIEAYLLIQGVDAVSPGLYHYRVDTHALDLLRPREELPESFALTAVAGQHWFHRAPLLVFLVARFARSQWKYRNHPKLYRAITLEAGHLSQNLYLAATQNGLGAFITAAINEIPIEDALGLDPMQQGVLAICGIGHRAAQRTTVELDPAGAIWPVAP
ncbi:MAG: putative peptide maturation dehydrogenase [Aquimonas sp.]|jgi:putative peptide maturation dehydrogenase